MKNTSGRRNSKYKGTGLRVYVVCLGKARLVSSWRLVNETHLSIVGLSMGSLGSG